jgi:hypothetical protein
LLAMQVCFTPPRHGPDRLVSEAEVRFEEGPLAGMRLIGFGVWLDPDGQLYVTFPSRSKGAGAERRYFDYLRSADGQPEAVRRVKAWIVQEYRNQRNS